ncbi:DUF1638 domain-containing protein [Aestuariibius sp. HNIBRBA575]|uniref:DUF1638 domain-containing protein n=1 Tax=Aestuariibius sp. HNIBRBA575 TaxID=3233343 RepID=UPI0034A34F89
MTEQGLDLSGSNTDLGTERVLILACGALAREILALIRGNNWHHLDLHCLPAILHNHPDRITDAVKDAVAQRRDQYTRIFVAYADCGTGGQLKSACDDMGVEMIKGPHCYSFYEGNDAFAAQGEVTCFYLTDFLARQFDAFVWKPLGLDRHPQLLDMYFGNYTTLVYQSQIDDPALVELARGHADRMGLAFEHRKTGYGDLAIALQEQAEKP